MVAGKAGTTPRISFLRDTPFVEFQFWTVGTEWEIYIRAFDDSDNEVGSFIGGGYWTTSFLRQTAGAEGRIQGPKINYLTLLCREAATGISYGCGAVALSTLNYVRAPEPGTLALLALGLAGLSLTRRKTA